MAFLDKILVDRRDLNHNIPRAVRHTLATETRLQRGDRGFLQLIKFIVRTFITAIKPLLHDDMAGRAGTNPPADMF